MVALGPPDIEYKRKKGGHFLIWKLKPFGKIEISKRRYVWCMEKGDIPAGIVVICLDKDPCNVETENLKLMTLSEMAFHKNKHRTKNPTNPTKDIDGIKHKFCNKCSSFQPMDNYFKRASGPGYYATCRDCLRDYSFHYARRKKKEKAYEENQM